jgi:hypothetical protein
MRRAPSRLLYTGRAGNQKLPDRVSSAIALALELAGLVADDYLRADADDPTPRNDRVAVDFRSRRPTVPARADAVPLEHPELAGDEARKAQASMYQLRPNVVDTAQRQA